LQKAVPRVDDQKVMKRLRDASIGFASSVVSDTSSNSLRVIKTTKQTFATPISYPEAVRYVIAQDGIVGLFGRGLKTRILANGLQGALFSFLWGVLKEKF
jgi:sulfopyruvate decarboxylase TPP-binding subunit